MRSHSRTALRWLAAALTALAVVHTLALFAAAIAYSRCGPHTPRTWIDCAAPPLAALALDRTLVALALSVLGALPSLLRANSKMLNVQLTLVYARLFCSLSLICNLSLSNLLGALLALAARAALQRECRLSVSRNNIAVDSQSGDGSSSGGDSSRNRTHRHRRKHNAAAASESAADDDGGEATPLLDDAESASAGASTSTSKHKSSKSKKKKKAKKHKADRNR